MPLAILTCFSWKNATQCDVKMYMFFMLDSRCFFFFLFVFSLIKGMKITMCDCLQKEGADICSLLFVSLYLCIIIFHECSGLEVIKSEKTSVET